MAIQLNAKSAKAFRDTLALWHIADFNKADADVTKSVYIKGRLACIETNENCIAKAEAKGQKTYGKKSIEKLQAEIAQFKADIDAERERVSALKDEYDKDTVKGLDLVTDEVVKAVIERSQDVYSAETLANLQIALSEWFVSNGFADATPENVGLYAVAISGQMKQSSRGKCKNNTHNKVFTSKDTKAVKNLLLGAICDEPTMKSILPIHKWENVIEKKTKKNTDK